MVVVERAHDAPMREHAEAVEERLVALEEARLQRERPGGRVGAHRGVGMLVHDVGEERELAALEGNRQRVFVHLREKKARVLAAQVGRRSHEMPERVVVVAGEARHEARDLVGFPCAGALADHFVHAAGHRRERPLHQAGVKRLQQQRRVFALGRRRERRVRRGDEVAKGHRVHAGAAFARGATSQRGAKRHRERSESGRGDDVLHAERGRQVHGAHSSREPTSLHHAHVDVAGAGEDVDAHAVGVAV